MGRESPLRYPALTRVVIRPDSWDLAVRSCVRAEITENVMGNLEVRQLPCWYRRFWRTFLKIPQKCLNNLGQNFKKLDNFAPLLQKTPQQL